MTHHRIQQIDQENQGLPAARNAGLSVAKGEFVNFLDADDLLLPNMLKRMVQKLNENTSIGAVYCGCIFFDPKIQDKSWVWFRHYEDGILFQEMAHRNLFPCHTILLRRAILENVGLFDCSLKHCHDWDLWLRVVRAGTSFGSISEPLVIYRMLPVSLSRSSLTFFQAGKEVISRAHALDRRVKKPVPELVQGCKCGSKDSSHLAWLLHCVGLAIAKGDEVKACELFEANVGSEDPQTTVNEMPAMRFSLWFGTGVPKGRWDVLWPRISRPLLQFLLRQEERLEAPGFAMQCVLQIVGWHELQRKANPETWYTRELLRALKKRIWTYNPQKG